MKQYDEKYLKIKSKLNKQSNECIPEILKKFEL
jgi:hypothetical protein